MPDTREKRGPVALFFIGVGIALVTLGISGNGRPTAQRALYLISGLLFIVAAVLQARKSGGWPKGSGDKPDGWPWWLS
jgi:sulfite exporter TauE/SafE